MTSSVSKSELVRRLDAAETEIKKLKAAIQKPKAKAKRKVGPDKSVLDHREGRALGEE